MTLQDLISIVPVLGPGAGAVIVVFVISFVRRETAAAILSLIALVSSLLFCAPALSLAPRSVGILFSSDPFAIFFAVLILCSAIFVSIFLFLYRASGTCGKRPEAYVVLLLATSGALMIVESAHFVSFFLGLETLSVSLYVLIAYFRTNNGIEASLKYLILASVSSAMLIFGVALVFMELGTLDLRALAEAAGSKNADGLYMLSGLALLLVGVGFKLAVVPFHLWAPDVYEGAPAPVGAFIATASKGALFAFALRYLSSATGHNYGMLWLAVSIIAVASMFAGNLLALTQTNLKRLLGYSSIAHAGYVLVALEADGPRAVEAVGYYLAVYFISMLGAFGVISALAQQGKEPESVNSYRGLAWHDPLAAVVLSVMLFSLAGIPFTAGFIGKFYILAAGMQSGLLLLVFSLIISSVIGLYYYLRAIVTMYREPEEGYVRSASLRPGARGILAVLGFFAAFLGIYPSPLIQILRTMLAG